MSAQPTITTAIRFPPETKERLRAVGDEHCVSANKLVNLAVDRFLDGIEPSVGIVLPPRPDPPPPPPHIPGGPIYSWRERRRMVRAYKQSIRPETH